MLGVKFNDGIRRFRLVGCQARQALIFPIRKVYNPCRLARGRRQSIGDRLDNVQSLAVEKKRMIPEQLV